MMAFAEITGNDVYREAELIIKPAMERANKGAEHLEDAWLKKYADAMYNMRARLETALAELDAEIGAR